MKTIAYLTVTGLALVQGAHIRGKSMHTPPGMNADGSMTGMPTHTPPGMADGGATYGTAMPSHDETTGHDGATYGTAMPSHDETGMADGSKDGMPETQTPPGMADGSMVYPECEKSCPKGCDSPKDEHKVECLPCKKCHEAADKVASLNGLDGADMTHD